MVAASLLWGGELDIKVFMRAVCVCDRNDAEPVEVEWHQVNPITHSVQWRVTSGDYCARRSASKSKYLGRYDRK